MSNELKIKVTGVLNTGSTIGEINTAIRGIEKLVNNIKLKIDIDNKALKNIEKFNENLKKMGDTATQTRKRIEETFRPDGTRTKNTYWEDGTVTKEMLKASEAAKKLQGANNQVNESVKNQVQSMKILDGEYDKTISKVTKLNAEQQKLSQSIKATSSKTGNTLKTNLDGQGKVKDYTITDNSSKNIEQASKRVADLHSKNLITTASFERMNKVIANTKPEGIGKLNDMLKRTEQRVSEINKQQKLELFKQNQLSALESFENKHKRAIRSSVELKNAIEKEKQSINGLTTSTHQLNNKMEQSRANIRNFNAQVAEAGRNSIGVIDAFNTAMVWNLAV